MLSTVLRQRPQRVLAQQVRALHTSNTLLGGGGTGREHVKPSGTKIDVEDMDGQYYHIPDVKDMNAHWRSNTFQERGQWWNKGREHSFLHNVFPYLGNQQDVLEMDLSVPYWPRTRLWLCGNYAFILKMEYLFFYIPAFLVLSLCMPGYACLYAMEDCIDCDMCIKVVGRQWYWVYEVESL